MASKEEVLRNINKNIFVKKYEDSYLELESLIKAHPEYYMAHIRFIELGLKQKTTNLQKKYYLKEMNYGEDKKLYEIVFGFVLLQEENIDIKRAEKYFLNLMEKHGENAPILYGLGICMQSMERFDSAIIYFEKSLNLDPEFCLSYFNLSQIYYIISQYEQGDNYFYLYESSSPYSVYGNFETHRTLAYEYLEKEKYEEATNAITTLSEWWLENKGHVPNEIKIYELLLISKIEAEKGESKSSLDKKNEALLICNETLADSAYNGEVLYFIAKTLEENEEPYFKNRFFKKLLTYKDLNTLLLDKICKQLVSEGSFDDFEELIEACYEVHPDHSKVRFYRLISKLRQNGTKIEEYLSLKEKLAEIPDTDSNRVKIFSMLNHLNFQYNKDPDVLGGLADIFESIGQIEQAEQRYHVMMEHDACSTHTKIKYCKFLLKNGLMDGFLEQMESLIDFDSNQDVLEIDKDLSYLKSEYFFLKNDFKSALTQINFVGNIESWNSKYIVSKIKIMESTILKDSVKSVSFSENFSQSGSEIAAEEYWINFDSVTKAWQEKSQFELVYLREKFRFLHKNEEEESYFRIDQAARMYDSQEGADDFVRLLNTNYHTSYLFLILGRLYKDLRLLEVSKVWYQTLLKERDIADKLRSEALIEIADCLIWQNSQLPKATEYLKLALDLEKSQKEEIFLKLAHAYLKMGEIDTAKIYINDLDGENRIERIFLNGLIRYRNGATQAAREIWKPILTVPTETLLVHNIKQEILKYYFDNQSYFPSNLA